MQYHNQQSNQHDMLHNNISVINNYQVTRIKFSQRVIRIIHIWLGLKLIWIHK